MELTLQQAGPNEVAITVRFPLQGNMLEMENQILDAVNKVGAAATEHALKRFDADGRDIRVGDVKFYSRGQFNQKYESPYGPVEVKRFVYQTAKGGRSFVPLEERARLVRNATPRYAQQITSKFANGGAPSVKRDLESNHARCVSLDYIKTLSDLMGALAQAREADWEYDLPPLPAPVKTLSVGLDGTCMFMNDEGGWRQAMVGTISLYDKAGERMHTIYTGATPEYGKETFLERLDRELERTRVLFPDATVQGLADGAADNWAWLSERTDVQVLDFWHLSEYVGRAGEAAYPKNPLLREEWVETWCHAFKHEPGTPKRFLAELRNRRRGLKGDALETLSDTARYVTNQQDRLGYPDELKAHRPIGSGVTEAACKTLIKERMCKAGMRWKRDGASAVVALRALQLTEGRWEQFWQKIAQFGVN